MVRCLTSEEAVRQQRHYDRNARAVALHPRDIVMVQTDRFMGKCKVKDWWQEGGYVVVKQLEDWPVYKVRGPPPTDKCKPGYQILHQNCLMLVPSEEDAPQDTTDLQAVAPIILNGNIMAFLAGADSSESESGVILPSLVTQQGGDKTPHVWLNGEFHTQLWTQSESKAIESPLSLTEDEVSDFEPVSSGSEEEEA